MGSYPDWRKAQVESTDEYNQWRLLNDMFYPLADGRVLCVKAGFLTDLASIPQILWNIYPPFDPEYRAAAILHDGLYASELLPRNECDWLLLEAMQAQGNSWWTRNVFWCSVRAAGGAVWAKHTDETRAEARNFVSLIPAESSQC